MKHFKKIFKTLPRLLILAGYLFSVSFSYYSPQSMKSCTCSKEKMKCSCSHEMNSCGAKMQHGKNRSSAVSQCKVASCGCSHDISGKHSEASVSQPFQLQKVNPEVLAVLSDEFFVSQNSHRSLDLTDNKISDLLDVPLFIKDLALLI